MNTPNPIGRLPRPPLLVITDRELAKCPLEEMVGAIFAGGCRWLLVRDKGLSRQELIDLTATMVWLAQPYLATVSLSGDPEAAREAGAHGVHLTSGQDVAAARRALGEEFLIGASTHGPDEAEAAERGGADYITLSPIFESYSKPGYGPTLGMAGLSLVVQARSVPVFALGGVTAAGAMGCLAVGAAGIAVMGQVMGADDPGEMVRSFVSALE